MTEKGQSGQKWQCKYLGAAVGGGNNVWSEVTDDSCMSGHSVSHNIGHRTPAAAETKTLRSLGGRTDES